MIGVAGCDDHAVRVDFPHQLSEIGVLRDGAGELGDVVRHADGIDIARGRQVGGLPQVFHHGLGEHFDGARAEADDGIPFLCMV